PEPHGTVNLVNFYPQCSPEHALSNTAASKPAANRANHARNQKRRTSRKPCVGTAKRSRYNLAQENDAVRDRNGQRLDGVSRRAGKTRHRSRFCAQRPLRLAGFARKRARNGRNQGNFDPWVFGYFFAIPARTRL